MYKEIVPIPNAISKELPELLAKAGEWSLPVPEIHRYKNVELSGIFALGFIGNDIVPSTHIWHDGALTKAKGRTVRREPSKTLEGVTVCLRNVYSNNYFHWTFENLAALIALLNEKIDRVIIHESAPRYMLETIRYVGYEGKVEKWTSDTIMCEELLAYGPLRYEGHTYKSTIESVRNKFTSFRLNYSPKRIYISRADAKERQVTNENQLTYFLKQYGFEVVRLKGTTYIEQVQLFSCAEIIVAPAGAGLTNMIWTDHCKVIELFGSYTNPCYFLLSNTIGHDYYYLACVPDDTNMEVPKEYWNELINTE